MRQIKFNFTNILLLMLITNTVVLPQSAGNNVQGFVFDAITREKLSNVSIFDSSSFNGVSSDSRGYFSFTLQTGTHWLKVSLIGYEPIVKKIIVIQNDKTEIVFKLNPNPIEIKTVTISGEKVKKLIKERTYDLTVTNLRNIPQVFEPDPLRIAQALPGVTSINDFSSQIFLRGGNFDETMIALDDVPLYNPNHLGGMFSSVNSDIVGMEELHLSNYPQRYGGYLSGILNIKTKKFNDKFSATASVGISSAKITIRTPLLKGSLMVSYRRTYLDIINLFLSDTGFPYSFSDFFLKYSYPIDSKNLIEISGFYSKDKYILFARGDYDYLLADPYPSWGNKLLKTSLLHIFSNNVSLNFNFFVSNGYMKSNFEKRRYSRNEYAHVNNTITDFTGRVQAEFSFPGNSLNTGFEIKNLSLNYNWDINSNDLSDLINPVQDIFFDYAPNPYNYKSSENIISFFMQDQIILNSSFTIQASLRFTYLNNLNKNYLLPLFRINYNPVEKIEFSFGYGKYMQYMNTFKERKSENFFAPFSTFFLPKNANEVGQTSHYLFGFYYNEFYFKSNLSIEFYYKPRQNLTSSYNTTPIYRFENGFAYGLDILLRKDIGKISGWIGYSYMNSKKEGKEYTYTAVYNRTNNFKLLLGYQLFNKWRINAFWTYSTGTSYTPISGKFISTYNYSTDRNPYIWINNSGLNWRGLAGRKNSHRFSASHRLDLGITGSFIWGNILVKPYLQILNVYNSPNPYFIQNESKYNSKNINKEIRGSAVIPTIGVSFEY